MNQNTDGSTSLFYTYSVQSKKNLARNDLSKTADLPGQLFWYNTIPLWKTCLGIKVSFPLLKHLFSFLNTSGYNINLQWNSSDAIHYLKCCIFTSRVAKKHDRNEITVLKLRGKLTTPQKIEWLLTLMLFHFIIFRSIKSLQLLFVNILF